MDKAPHITAHCGDPKNHHWGLEKGKDQFWDAEADWYKVFSLVAWFLLLPSLHVNC